MYAQTAPKPLVSVIGERIATDPFSTPPVNNLAPYREVVRHAASAPRANAQSTRQPLAAKQPIVRTMTHIDELAMPKRVNPRFDRPGNMCTVAFGTTTRGEQATNDENGERPHAHPVRAALPAPETTSPPVSHDMATSMAAPYNMHSNENRANDNLEGRMGRLEAMMEQLLKENQRKDSILERLMSELERRDDRHDDMVVGHQRRVPRVGFAPSEPLSSTASLQHYPTDSAVASPPPSNRAWAILLDKADGQDPSTNSVCELKSELNNLAMRFLPEDELSNMVAPTSPSAFAPRRRHDYPVPLTECQPYEAHSPQVHSIVRRRVIVEEEDIRSCPRQAPRRLHTVGSPMVTDRNHYSMSSTEFMANNDID